MLQFLPHPPKTKRQQKFQVRKTIKHSGFVEGIGLHSGENMRLIFHPAEEGTGIVFWKRNSVSERSLIPADVRHVIDTSLATTIGADGEYIQTIEHLMYALFVLGITDLLLEVQGGHEIPILDGSARDFIATLNELEIHEHREEVEPILITKPVMVNDGNRYLVALPADSFKVSYTIDYPHPLLKDLSIQLDYDRDFFIQEIGSARTFGFLRDVELLRQRGLAQGGSIDNALVYTPEGTLNTPRFELESLYHKILDLIGDLALLGRPIRGHILGSRGGHALDVAFGKKILKVCTGMVDVDYYPITIAL